MIFKQKPSSSKKFVAKGLLSMEPRPVIKRHNMPGSTRMSNNKPACVNPPNRYHQYQCGDPILDCTQFEDDLKCPICSELFVEATTLSCSHTFCKYCIERWRQTNEECPICRGDIDYQVHVLVLDHVVEMILRSQPQQVRKQREALIKERLKELSKRRKYVQKPVQTVYHAQVGNLLGSFLLEALDDTDETSSEMGDELCHWEAYDPTESSTDEYDYYGVYNGRACY